MVNRYRGEIEAEIGGSVRVLCLTLGGLAEIEQALGLDDLGALPEHFAQGKLRAQALIAILGAGLRGGGLSCTNEEVAQMHTPHGLTGFAEIVARLLEATFTPPAEQARSGNSL